MAAGHLRGLSWCCTTQVEVENVSLEAKFDGSCAHLCLSDYLNKAKHRLASKEQNRCQTFGKTFLFGIGKERCWPSLILSLFSV